MRAETKHKEDVMQCWQATKAGNGCTYVDRPFLTMEACIAQAEETFGDGYTVSHISFEEALKNPDFAAEYGLGEG